MLVSSVERAKYYSSELSVTACDGGDLAPRAARPRLDYVLDAGGGGAGGVQAGSGAGDDRDDDEGESEYVRVR